MANEKKKYCLTDAHRTQMASWRDRWIANAMSTKPMTEDDREACRRAVVGMYASANLPPPKHIVFVPSPFVLRIAGGFAAAIWWLARNGSLAATHAATLTATDDATRDATFAVTYDATHAATRGATLAATDDATRDATFAATFAATDDATRAATRDATFAATHAATTRDALEDPSRGATRDATRDATDDATYAATHVATHVATHAATLDATDDATYAATHAATHAATLAATDDATQADAAMADTWSSPWMTALIMDLAREIGGANADLFVCCAASAYSMWDGGNQWSGYPAWISFFRYIVRLGDTHGVDYTAWDHYEVLSERSGPRVMHPDFCMISDRPEVLTVDDQNRPHADSGPFCRWRDGSALYSYHGVRVPWWVIEHPERLTVDRIHAEENEEVRRVMVERYGLTRYVRDSKFELVNQDVDPVGQPRRLLRRDGLLVVELVNSTVDADGTRRVYHVSCEPNLRPLLPDGTLGEPQKMTALNAVASTYGLRGEEYKLEVET